MLAHTRATDSSMTDKCKQIYTEKKQVGIDIKYRI